jgi:HAD superfamily phosphoserine phosphatase-like hydrolase
MKSEKYMFVDFCGTLVSKQTANNFVDYYLWMNNLKLQWIKSKLVNEKFIKLSHLINQNKGSIDLTAQSYAKHLMTYNREGLIEILKTAQISGYKLFVISAGYSIYIKKWLEINEIQSILIANDFEYNNDFFRGSISDNDCIGEQKVLRLSKIINLESIDWFNSYVFSDSLTDKPLFDLVRNKIFITKDLKIKELIKLSNHEF